MAIPQTLPLFGYASGVAAADTRCADGPLVLHQSELIQNLLKFGINASWEALLKPEVINDKYKTVANICSKLAKQICLTVEQNKRFALFAGDHSCAMGTWGGVLSAKQNLESSKASIGLVWIDAHMDSHTPDTTESGNIHGMPLAVLLGYGAKELTSIMPAVPTLQPEHVSLIGVRSFEQGEADLIKRLGVRVYYMEEVQQRGVGVVLAEAIERASKNTQGYGISLDLDAIDPEDAPGTGAPEPNGIRGQEMVLALQNAAKNEKFLGIEMVEFNPHRDIQYRTQQLINNLLVAVFAN